jgi:hypothetical protein
MRNVPDKFRIATLLTALLLGWFAITTIFAETFSPERRRFSRDLTELDPVCYGRLADRTAKAAPLRGDFKGGQSAQ